MPAIKLTAFGGMVPSQDDRLLSDQSASRAEDTWLYAGRLQGMREPKHVYTTSGPGVGRVFRIPIDKLSKDNMVDSYWLEFTRRNVDVVRSPMDNDTYQRFYWAGDDDGNGLYARYTTLQRIIDGDPAFKLGVPAPETAPEVNTSPTGDLSAINEFYNVEGRSVQIRYSGRTSPTDSFETKVFSVNTAGATLTYRNTSNVEAYDALTSSLILDPDFPRTAGLSESRILVSRAYAYTWVTEYGEEGPPSPATVFTGMQDDNWNITLTAPTSTVANVRNITKVRIYRTVTSSLGQATFFLVDELDISETSYQDTNLDEDVSSNNLLQSTTWDPPPDGLQGFAPLPNGIIAGFKDNELWFCEPFRPHAWPASYSLSVDFPIVGLGVVGQSVIVCTESSTYACTGVTPATMSLSIVGSTQPCVSRGGIVSTKNGVFYPSPNGLVGATPAGLTLITDKLITRDKWFGLMNINRMQGAVIGNAYYAFGIDGLGVFNEDAYEPTMVETEDTTGSFTGALIDISEARAAYVILTSDDATRSVFNDPWTGEVLVLRAGSVYHHDIASGTYGQYLWRSKIFQLPFKKNMQAMKVFFDVPDGVTDYGSIKLYADGTEVWERNLVTSGEMMRLPSGFKADFWQVEVSGRVAISSIQMGTSARELAGV